MTTDQDHPDESGTSTVQDDKTLPAQAVDPKAEPQDKAPVLEPSTSAPAIDADDVDAAELKAAQALLQKEEQGEQGDQDAEKKDDDAEKKAAPESDDRKGGEKKSPMIPKARFDEVAKERDEALRAAHYFRGVADARGQSSDGQKQPDGKGPEKPKSFDEQLEEVAVLEDEIAKKYEAGEIGEVEKTKLLRELRRREDVLRDDRLQTAIKASIPPAPAPASDLRLQELTAELEKTHPYTGLIPVFDPFTGGKTGHWEKLQTEAIKSLAEDGVTIPVGKTLNAELQYALRARMAALTDTYGPEMTGIPVDQVMPKPAQKDVQPSGQGKGQKQPGPALTPQQRARLDGLRKASEAPPDIHGIGSPAQAQVTFTDSEIAAMSDEEITARLPESARRKMLETQP